MTNAQEIYSFLRGKGLTEAGALGLMGNLQAESGLFPCRLQGDYQDTLNQKVAFDSDVLIVIAGTCKYLFCFWFLSTLPESFAGILGGFFIRFTTSLFFLISLRFVKFTVFIVNELTEAKGCVCIWLREVKTYRRKEETK